MIVDVELQKFENFVLATCITIAHDHFENHFTVTLTFFGLIQVIYRSPKIKTVLPHLASLVRVFYLSATWYTEFIGSYRQLCTPKIFGD